MQKLLLLKIMNSSQVHKVTNRMEELASLPSSEQVKLAQACGVTYRSICSPSEPPFKAEAMERICSQ